MREGDAGKPNHKLREQRLRRGWTQVRVADELYKLCEPGARRRGEINANMVGRWERGEYPPSLFYQERLCPLFGKSAQELGFVESFTASITQKSHQLLGIVQEPETAKKEQGLKETEHYFDQRTVRLEKWVIDGLEDGTYLRWQLYYTSRNSLTEEGLFNQIVRLEQLVDDVGMGAYRAYRVLIQNYQLAGSLARDNFHSRRAEKYFREAHQLSKEIHSSDLAATSVARHALVLLREERVEDALTLYHGAAHIATHAEPYVRAYVLSGLAEALARNGLRDDCYRTLDQAEKLLDRAHSVPLEEDFAQVRLTLQSLEDARGECYVLLGEPSKGLEYLQTAQRHLNPTISRNLCRLLMQQSEAYFAAGLPDQCVHYALKGLQLARTLESVSNINWSHEIHSKLLLSKWKDESIVGELRAAI